MIKKTVSLLIVFLGITSAFGKKDIHLHQGFITTEEQPKLTKIKE